MYWLAGELIETDTINLAIGDVGLIYGATVFTTLRVYHQSLDHPLTNWNAHCDRLYHSLKTFAWQSPPEKVLRQGAEALLPYYPVLRITIFPDGREWITGRQLPSDLIQSQQQGVIGWLATDCLYQRCLATHKTGNYLTAWLALKQAQKMGALEAILIDNDGNWLETSTGNLWGWKDNCWWTPPVNNILPGIVRNKLYQWILEKYAVKEAIWSEDFVRDLQAIAYTNSVREIVPFSAIITSESVINFNNFPPAIEQLKSYFS